MTVVSSIDALARSTPRPEDGSLILNPTGEGPYAMQLEGRLLTRAPIVGWARYVALFEWTPNNDDMPTVSEWVRVDLGGTQAKVRGKWDLQFETGKVINTLIDYLLDHGFVADRGGDNVLEGIYARVSRPSHGQALCKALKRSPGLADAPFFRSAAARLGWQRILLCAAAEGCVDGVRMALQNGAATGRVSKRAEAESGPGGRKKEANGKARLPGSALEAAIAGQSAACIEELILAKAQYEPEIGRFTARKLNSRRVQEGIALGEALASETVKEHIDRHACEPKLRKWMGKASEWLKQQRAQSIGGNDNAVTLHRSLAAVAFKWGTQHTLPKTLLREIL